MNALCIACHVLRHAVSGSIGADDAFTRRFVTPCAAAAAIFLSSLACVADQPTQKDLDELRGVIEANFAACNRHDLKGVLATFHPKVPQDMVEQFKQEAETCFKESKITIRLVSMYVNSFEDPWTPSRVKIAQHANIGTTTAEVEIVQMAVPAEHSFADLEEYPAQLSTDFRNRSALLPKHQVIKYTTRFWYDYQAKKWKMFAIISVVEPVGKWPENTRAIMQGEPPDVFSRYGVASEPTPKRGGRK